MATAVQGATKWLDITPDQALKYQRSLNTELQARCSTCCRILTNPDLGVALHDCKNCGEAKVTWQARTLPGKQKAGK